jgi:hypothetical protein
MQYSFIILKFVFLLSIKAIEGGLSVIEFMVFKEREFSLFQIPREWRVVWKLENKAFNEIYYLYSLIPGKIIYK